MLDSKIYNIILLICIILTIFLPNLNMMFFPKQADIAIAIILLIIAIFFIGDSIVRVVYKAGYFMSYTFFMDIISLLALIPDFIDLFSTVIYV